MFCNLNFKTAQRSACIIADIADVSGGNNSPVTAQHVYICGVRALDHSVLCKQAQTPHTSRTTAVLEPGKWCECSVSPCAAGCVSLYMELQIFEIRLPRF